jgi:hypothetical protein
LFTTLEQTLVTGWVSTDDHFFSFNGFAGLWYCGFCGFVGFVVCGFVVFVVFVGFVGLGCRLALWGLVVDWPHGACPSGDLWLDGWSEWLVGRLVGFGLHGWSNGWLDLVCMVRRPTTGTCTT